MVPRGFDTDFVAPGNVIEQRPNDPESSQNRTLRVKMTEDEIRQRFEAWISSRRYCESVARIAKDSVLYPGQYCRINVQSAWEVWLEAWQQAIGQQSVESE